MDHVVPTSSLKGVCHEMRWFDLHFFHDSNPSRPLMNRLKCFGIRFWFPRDIQIFKKLCSVHPTTVSSSKVLRCASHRGVKWSKVFLKTLRCASFRGVHPSAELSSAVCIIPQSLTPQYASHRGVNNLPTVGFPWKFYRCYFSVMPEDINMK